MNMEEIQLIEIPQQKPEYSRFIGSWLVRGAKTILVDVGPANTADNLISLLKGQGIFHIDYVLLTHIHIDHAGALGKLLQEYQEAKAVCHEKALRYLVEPAKLWQGSLRVLGQVAEMYGPPIPTSPTRLIAHNEFKLKDLAIIDTPGHAPHHLSFEYNGRLFSGEAAGNYLMVNDRDYLRPATPPRFFLEMFVSSIEKLRQLPDQIICYAHFGSAPSSHDMLDRFKEQVLFWAELIGQEARQGGDDIIERCIDRLIAEDGNLACFDEMDAHVRARELNFMANAVKGFLGYFEEDG